MTSTSKTVREWIKDLPLDIQEKYIANLDYKDTLDDLKMTFSSCLTSAFIWSKTPEGIEFWKKISERDYTKTKETINNTYEIY